MKFAYLAIIVTLFPISGVAGEPLPEDVRAELDALAGVDALSCGAVPLGVDPSEAAACARAAVSSKNAFWVAFQRRGTDSILWEGAAGDGSGNLFALFYDSDITGSLSGESRLGVSRCDRLRFTRYQQPIVRCRESRSDS